MGQSKPTSQPAVLVVEDEVLVRLELVDAISELGYRVYEAGNADEAIKLMEANPGIHVLITDIDMPGSMDGLKLSHFVRDRWPPVKIVVASGHVKVMAGEMPAQGIFVDKPYDTPRMMALLAQIAEDIHTS